MIYKLSKEELNNLSNIKIDWQIHLVSDNKGFKKYMCDAHTHGINKFFNTEIQMVLNIDSKLIANLINDIGRLIKSGYKFTEGDLLYNLLTDDMPIGFINAKDYEGEPILRILLPDVNGEVYKPNVTDVYAMQYENPYIN